MQNKKITVRVGGGLPFATTERNLPRIQKQYSHQVVEVIGETPKKAVEKVVEANSRFDELMLLKKSELQELCDTFGLLYEQADNKTALSNAIVNHENAQDA